MIRLIINIGRDIMLINIVTKLCDDLIRIVRVREQKKFNLGINQLRGHNFFRSDMDNLSGYYTWPRYYANNIETKFVDDRIKIVQIRERTTWVDASQPVAAGVPVIYPF